MTKTLAVWLFYQLPEAVLLFYCGTRLLGLRLGPRKLWLTAFLFSILVPLARALPIPFGLHTPLLFGAYVLLAVAILRVSVRTAATAATIGFFLLTMGESLVVVPVLTTRKIAVEGLLTSISGQLLGGYLESSILIAVSLLALLFNFKLIQAPEATPSPGQGRAGAAGK